MVHPKKAFIVGALEKEIRLSFAARIRGTLPEPYQPLVSEAQEEDTPPFKYQSDRKNILPLFPPQSCADALAEEPYADQARQMLQLFKRKASESEMQDVISGIEEKASELGIVDPAIRSTDVFVTTICYVGSKSLSHTLSQIERCKERLLAIGPHSESARRQIISSVMEYWHEKPGVGVAVIDKLLNYTILTPQSVLQWALGEQLGKGQNLTKAYVYEMVASTLSKVNGRVRQVVAARNAPDLSSEQRELLDQTLASERGQMSTLFAIAEDALQGVAEGSNDTMAEGANADTEEATLRQWGNRWLRIIRRRRGSEEGWVLEMLQQAESSIRREELAGSIAKDPMNGTANKQDQIMMGV